MIWQKHDFSGPPSVKKNDLDQEPIISQLRVIALIKGFKSGTKETETFSQILSSNYDLLPKFPCSFDICRYCISEIVVIGFYLNMTFGVKRVN